MARRSSDGHRNKQLYLLFSAFYVCEGGRQRGGVHLEVMETSGDWPLVGGGGAGGYSESGGIKAAPAPTTAAIPRGSPSSPA